MRTKCPTCGAPAIEKLSPQTMDSKNWRSLRYEYAPEPSDEPPDPSEITPGEKVPTEDGRHAFIYPGNEGSFVGTVAVMPNVYKAAKWDSNGRSNGPPGENINWREWRLWKEQETKQ